MGKRIRAFLLGFSMLVSVLNPSIVYAEEPPVDETPIEVIDEGENVGVTEEPATGEETGEEPELLPEESSEPEIIEEPEETVEPEVTPVPEEVIIPEETEEPVDIEEEPEEESVEETDEEAVLFEAPEGFAVSKSDVAGKAALHDMNILRDFSGMEEGKDYAARELVFLTDDRVYAEQVAEIYHAELTSFEHGVAVITITDPDISVEDVFKASLDSDFELPLVEPNYITYLDPIEEKPSPVIEEGSELFSDSLPEVKGWTEWVNDAFGPDADPALKTPSDENFQWQHTMINTYAGWNATMGQGVTVAVIDEGINVNHEDFDGRVTVENVTGDNTWDGHGNHVAGIIGASAENSVGGAGIAPKVNILGINVFTIVTDEDGNEAIKCKNNHVIEGLEIAINHGVDIINMSLGGPSYSTFYQMEIDKAYDAEIVICAAAGNENTNSKSYPAAYDHVISVAAVNRNGVRAGYSNYGSWVTISAPGSDIYSVFSQDYYHDEDGYLSNNSYEMMDGTSMACPVVSGALALYMSRNGHKNYDEILPIIKSSAIKCSSKQMGAGIISVEKLFSKKETAPEIKVYFGEDDPITSFKNPVPEGSKIDFYCEDMKPHETLLYTLDGKNPAVKNGEIVCGNIYDQNPILIDSFAKGTTITVKAAVTNELGVLGNIKTLKIKTPLPQLKIKTLVLDKTKAALISGGAPGTDTLSLDVSKLLYTDGTPAGEVDPEGNINYDLDLVNHSWTSSNTKVAVVDEDGVVTAVGGGSAKITLKLLDGSKKSAVCTVTVTQLASEINITGQDIVVPGSSATYKASVLPNSTKNKSVTWKLDEGSTYPEGLKIDAKTGKVTIPASAADDPVKTFTICAEAKDGSEIVGYKTVEVGSKITALKFSNYFEDERIVYKKGIVNSVNIFTVNIQDDTHDDQDERIFDLSTLLYVENDNGSIVWTSSKPGVATVDENGNVTAVSKGTTKITASANDGSKKKAAVNVIVTVPISNLSIDLGENYFLCAGKSLSLKDKAMYGTQYGSPSKKSVKWSISKVEYTTYMINPDTGEYEPSMTHDMTNYVLKNKWITIASNSKLSVSKKIWDHFVEDFNLKVYLRADAQDGTNYYYDQYEHKEDGEGIYVTPPQGSVIIENYYSGAYPISNDEGYYYNIYMFSKGRTNFQITSSNPNVLGADYAGYLGSGSDYIYQNGRLKYVTGHWYKLRLHACPGKKGTVTITAKAMDGSGKSGKLKVKVG